MVCPFGVIVGLLFDNIDRLDLHTIIFRVHRVTGRDRENNIHPIHHLTKDAVLTIQPGCGHMGDEELRAIGVRAAFAMERMPGLLWRNSLLNSSLKEYPGPPAPVPVGSPPWAMKFMITRWKIVPS